MTKHRVANGNLELSHRGKRRRSQKRGEMQARKSSRADSLHFRRWLAGVRRVSYVSSTLLLPRPRLSTRWNHSLGMPSITARAPGACQPLRPAKKRVQIFSLCLRGSREESWTTPAGSRPSYGPAPFPRPIFCLREFYRFLCSRIPVDPTRHQPILGNTNMKYENASGTTKILETTRILYFQKETKWKQLNNNQTWKES